jgi:hypothetical protein
MKRFDIGMKLRLTRLIRRGGRYQLAGVVAMTLRRMGLVRIVTLGIPAMTPNVALSTPNGSVCPSQL